MSEQQLSLFPKTPNASSGDGPVRTSAATSASTGKGCTGKTHPCGLKCCESPSSADRIGSSLRTLIHCELAESMWFSADWKNLGTPHGRSYWALATPGHLTSESDAASFPDWRTPTAAEAEKISNRPNYGQPGLSNHPAIVGYPIRTRAAKSDSGGGPLGQMRRRGRGSQTVLSPEWVEALMGFPIGWTSPIGRKE